MFEPLTTHLKVKGCTQKRVQPYFYTRQRNTETLSWYTSDRAKRLPKDWPARKRTVYKRARGLCQAPTHTPGCTGKGTEVDHIIAGDNHNLDNLQLLSHECHKEKTIQENINRRRHAAHSRLLPPETHPGRIIR